MSKRKKSLRSALKLVVPAVLLIFGLFFAINATILVLGVMGTIPPPSFGSTSNVASASINMPNNSLFSIDGRIETVIMDRATGKMIGYGTSLFNLDPRKDNLINIDVDMLESSQNEIMVKIELYVEVLGNTFPVPISIAETTMPPIVEFPDCSCNT